MPASTDSRRDCRVEKAQFEAIKFANTIPTNASHGWPTRLHPYLTDPEKAMDVLTRQTVWAVPLGRHIVETAERVEKLPQVWTEQLKIGPRLFRIRLNLADNSKGYAAHCLDLPGTLEHGKTPDDAVRKLKGSILAVLAYMKGQNRKGLAVAKHAAN